MPSKRFILFASDSAWHAGADNSLLEIKLPANATPDQIAPAAAKALKQLGHGASPITLAIPSNWCLAAPIRTDDLPKTDYKSLLYRLEEKLPWPAESITADFIRHDQDKIALGICIKTEKVRPLIDALESHGIPIQTITPTALLAATHAQGLLIIPSPDHLDLLAMKDGKPIAWSVATTDDDDLELQLQLLSLDHPDMNRITLENPQSLALHNQSPLINLRRHDLAAADKLRLHRRALNALLASAAILLITLTGLFLFRSHQYQQQAQQSSQQLNRAFATHFPAWETPPNIRAVIESEHRRLITSPTTDLPPQATASAIPTLYALLSNLPADTTLNVQHLTINPDSLDLEAQLKTYEDADAIAAAARKAGLDVPPPQVRKENNNLWSLSLHATKAKPVAQSIK